MRVCASLNENIDSILAFKQKKKRKRKTGNSILSVINFWPVEAANLKAGSTDEGNSKGMLLCFAIFPPERRAYHEEHARTTKFIYAHMQSLDITEKVKVQRMVGGVVMPSSHHYYGKTCKSAPLVSALMSSVLSKHSA